MLCLYQAGPPRRFRRPVDPSLGLRRRYGRNGHSGLPSPMVRLYFYSLISTHHLHPGVPRRLSKSRTRDRSGIHLSTFFSLARWAGIERWVVADGAVTSRFFLRDRDGPKKSKYVQLLIINDQSAVTNMTISKLVFDHCPIAQCFIAHLSLIMAPLIIVSLHIAHCLIAD